MEHCSLELSFRYRFEAAHRFIQTEACNCSTPHGHTWHATLGFRTQGVELDERNMVVEFASLKSQWKAFITDVVDHSYLHHYMDPIVPVLREHQPGLRALPFPGEPTTEMIASLFFAKAWALYEPRISSGRVPQPAWLRLEETPTNQVSFYAPSGPIRGPLAQAPGFAWLAHLQKRFQGWWQSGEIEARELMILDL